MKYKKECVKCKKSFTTNRSNQLYCKTSCKRGHSVIRRRRKVATIITDYLGGECVVCGYKKSHWALHAHHINPEDKEFGLGMRGLTKSLKKMLEEANKCVLLCANCHAEYHAGLIDTAILSEANEKLLPVEVYLESLERAETIIGKPKLTPEKKHFCKCGVEVSCAGVSCVKCMGKSRQKINWPDTLQLIEMVEKTSYLNTAKKLGVSDNAVRKRIRNHPVG